MIPEWYQTSNSDGSDFYPLDFYIKRMRNNQYFSRPVFGDGEFRWMIGEERLVGLRGCEAPDLMEAFVESAKIALMDKNYFLASRDRKICPAYYDSVRPPHNDSQVIFKLIEKVGLKNYEWHNAQLFQYTVLAGTFGLFLKQLNKMNVVIIGNEKLKVLKEKGLNYDFFIESFRTKDWGYNQRHHIIKEILKYNKPAVYLLCCGDAASFVITKLYKKIPKSYFIDIGISLDLLVGYAFWGHNIPFKKNRENIVEYKKQQNKIYEKIQSNFEFINMSKLLKKV